MERERYWGVRAQGVAGFNSFSDCDCKVRETRSYLCLPHSALTWFAVRITRLVEWPVVCKNGNSPWLESQPLSHPQRHQHTARVRLRLASSSYLHTSSTCLLDQVHSASRSRTLKQPDENLEIVSEQAASSHELAWACDSAALWATLKADHPDSTAAGLFACVLPRAQLLPGIAQS